jgi:site-specific DNA recombinase
LNFLTIKKLEKMKNVILYIRVSTEEQAERGFSLAAQQELLTKYAKLRGWNILKVFCEDYSAWKGFDRPEYNKLKQFVLENKKSIDSLLFTQWSRFSRDYTEAAVEIKRLRAIGIEPNAVEQWIDFSIPENLYLLAFYLTAPQVENDRLSQRTKAGNRQALKQGRWLWKAPLGYKNNRLTKLIEVDEFNAEIVREAFQMMATGLYSAEEVRRKLYDKGLNLTKQAFINMLQNIVYIGRVKVPALKDEPEELVYGQHLPLIDVESFNDVQLILRGKKKSYKGLTKKVELPLVGSLVCPKCGRRMTGSGSRSRNKSIIHYYHCQRKYGCKNSFNAESANQHFYDFLKQFEFEPEVIELYHSILEDVFNANSTVRETEKVRLAKTINQLQERLETATTKNLDGIWDDATYLKVKQKIDDELTELLTRLNTLKETPTEFAKYISYSTSLLSNLTGYYKEANTETKKKLVGLIFPEKLTFENNNYRTEKINEVLGLLCTVGKGFNKKQPRKNSRLSTIAPQSGLEPETL